MIRILVENIVLFALPTVIYVSYMLLRRRGEPNLSPSQILEDAPLFWLFSIGVMLAVVVLATFGSFEQADPGRAYIPPRVEDGTYYPGTYR